jgi:RimJ/RimL family protein N-acetyltransferase
MHHNIIVEKCGIRLRPVLLEDAEFIYNLRRTPELSKFIGDTDPRLEKQIEWLEKYFLRDGDYYFCIETISGIRVGTIGIYDVKDSLAEWGRWIITPSMPASPASVWLNYHIAFDILNLSEVYCRTVEDNKHVVSFHDSCGLKRKGMDINGVQLNGENKNLIIHVAKREFWPQIQQRMGAPLMIAGRLLSEVK